MRPAAALLALLFLAPPAPAAKSGAPPILTIRELRALTPEQAAEGRPARITGVITFYDPARFLAFIQDETGGVYFNSRSDTNAPPPPLRIGDQVELTGVSGSGGFRILDLQAPLRYLRYLLFNHPAETSPRPPACSTHGCKSWWWTHPHAPAAPAPCGLVLP
jgi:hypothetical protein